MAEKAPGIFFEESDARLQITADNDATVAMAGVARRGPVDKSLIMGSWAEFVRFYGGFSSSSIDLGIHAHTYFRRGGSRLRVLRIVDDAAVTAKNTSEVVQRKDGSSGAMNAYAANPGVWGNEVAVSTKRLEVQAQGAPDPNDASGNELPNNNDNQNSFDSGRLVLESLANIEIGDVFDVFNPADGSWVSDGPIMVVGTDPSSTAIYFIPTSTTGSSSFNDNCPSNAILRTSAMHRGRARVVSQVAHGDSYVDLSTTEGIKAGSLLTLHLFSHMTTGSSTSVAQKCSNVVKRVVGNRVYFESTVDASGINDTTFSASVKAHLKIVEVGGPPEEGLLFRAKSTGPAGNNISVEVKAAQPANSVTVTDGKHIVINSKDYTVETAVTAIESHATANALVSVSRLSSEDPAAGLDQNHTQAFLTGGANLLAETQEFYLKVSDEGVEKEEHEYLSFVTTSSDYVRTRLGGSDDDPPVPDDRNESNYIVLNGDDGVVEAGSVELEEIPLAVDSVALSSGADGGTPLKSDIIGVASPRSGIHLFSEFDDIDFLAAPGYTSADIQTDLADYAKDRADLRAIMDCPESADTKDELLAHRQQDFGDSNMYASLFEPYLKIIDPRPTSPKGVQITVPPSPSVLAELAKVKQRGFHYSCGNRPLDHVVGLIYNVMPAEHGDLDAVGVSVIRLVARQGIRIFGDKTLLSTSDVRQFGNVRDWLNFMKQGIARSLTPYLFEPIDTRIMGKIERALDQWLEGQWKAGALYPQDLKRAAYQVKCDSETTTADDIENARVVAVIAVSPAPQMQQIKFLINVSAGGVRVDEAA